MDDQRRVAHAVHGGGQGGWTLEAVGCLALVATRDRVFPAGGWAAYGVREVIGAAPFQVPTRWSHAELAPYFPLPEPGLH